MICCRENPDIKTPLIFSSNHKIVYSTMITITLALIALCALGKFQNFDEESSHELTKCYFSATGVVSQSCVNKMEGYYADGCDKYYYCKEGTKYSFDCSSGTGWPTDFFCNNEMRASIMNSKRVSVTEVAGEYRNKCTSEGWMNDNFNCKLYFKCYLNQNSLSQVMFDITNICSTSTYLTNCSKMIGEHYSGFSIGITRTPFGPPGASKSISKN